MENIRWKTYYCYPITDRTRKVGIQFVNVYFRHVFRELNKKANEFSIKALLLQEGVLSIAEEGEGGSLPVKVLSLFD